MARILTHSEYQSLSATFPDKKGEPEHTTPRPAPCLHESVVKKNETKKEYFFIHPDKLHDHSDGKFIVIRSNGHVVEIPIEGGCLKTDDEEIKKELMSKGIIFISEREVINE